MMRNNPALSEIHLLNEKIQMLRSRKEVLEEQLEDNWIYLQEKYPSLIGNTLFKRFTHTPKTTMLGYLFALPVLQKVVRYLTGKMLIKAGNVLLRWLKKVTG